MSAANQIDRITWHGVFCGIYAAIPISLGVAPIGVVYGLTAIDRGLTPLEAIMTSAMIFGGASQFLAIELWDHPLPVLSLLLTVLAANLRHLVMGAALAPWLRHVRAGRAYPCLYFMSDHMWGLMMHLQRTGPTPQFGVMLGSGIFFYLTWVGATAIGALFGAVVTQPDVYGLDVLGVSFFIALLVTFWSGPEDILPWVSAATASVIAVQFVDNGINILIGAGVGVAVGVWRDHRKSSVTKNI